MDSTGTDGDEDRQHSHVVELVAATEPSDLASEDQITPLLTQSDKPKINIFTVSYPRRKANKVLRKSISLCICLYSVPNK